MPVPLRPQNNFTVVRQIANHLDQDTNYVQAVIRNAYTDEIIATLNLDDKGGQRFTKNWRVPADTSGQGFYVSIITSVYTDSGYTTKNDNYGDEENTYLVSDVFAAPARVGGGALDAFTIRRIVREELAGLPKIEIPEPKEPVMRWDEVLASLQSLEMALSRVPTEKQDTAPILTAIKAVKSAVEAKEITPPTDLAPVLKRLDEIAPTVKKLIPLLANAQERLSKDMEDQLIRLLKDTQFAIAPTTGHMLMPKERVPFDIRSLAS